jgi:predicted nucleotidyltransferase component of viral defense system
MLDIAQDHALCHLHETDLFSLGLVFKGGTALRKCRAGPAGRFSTDLDFAAPESRLASLVLDALNGYQCHGFRFILHDVDAESGRADLYVEAPFSRTGDGPSRLGIPSKVELSPRPCWQPPDVLPLRRSPVHAALGHHIPDLPVMTVVESVSEKLARYARVGLARDLYDLIWYGQAALDEAMIRRMWIQKVYGDNVIDGRWKRAFDPSEILIPRTASSIDEESIGFLTQPADIPGWEREFRQRYAFLAKFDDEDTR